MSLVGHERSSGIPQMGVSIVSNMCRHKPDWRFEGPVTKANAPSDHTPLGGAVRFQ
jgi:hypothetical protein